jgi:hypothetical protein
LTSSFYSREPSTLKQRQIARSSPARGRGAGRASCFAGAEYNQFVLSISTIKTTIERDNWINNGRSPAASTDQRLQDAIFNLRTCLAPLPDEQIPAATAGLSFNRDKKLRENIRGDIASADQAFSGMQWKAATVRAGAAAEALLLWAITQKSSSEVETSRKGVIRKADKDPTKWDLDGYLKVARQLGVIEADTQSKVI